MATDHTGHRGQGWKANRSPDGWRYSPLRCPPFRDSTSPSPETGLHGGSCFNGGGGDSHALIQSLSPGWNHSKTSYNECVPSHMHPFTLCIYSICIRLGIYPVCLTTSKDNIQRVYPCWCVDSQKALVLFYIIETTFFCANLILVLPTTNLKCLFS